MMAFIRVIAVALALASSTAWSSHPFESARDQYEAREDSPQPLQLLTEATDHRPEVRMSHRIDFIEKSTDSSEDSSKKLTIPDLQVGCGDGFIQEKLQEHSEKDKNKLSSKKLKKRIVSTSRRRRSYTPWVGQIRYHVPYQSISVWQPPTYQISRPYFIPIFGVPGRAPIYFPPQVLNYNPGVPKDNPGKPFQAPGYLPPAVPTTEPTTASTMDVGDRFGDDDRPVWDLGGANPTRRPFTTTAIVPTRATRIPGVPKTHPPLIHASAGGASSSQQSNDADNFIPRPPQAQTKRPPARAPASSTLRPEPSRCVWAIISCCSSSGDISYDCFEERGCQGAFWDNNPCDSDYAKAAIAAALNYYN